MNSVEAGIVSSSRCFVDVVWPVIRKSLGGGRISPVEGNIASRMQKDLDRISGIDAWHITNGDQGIRGIASRVQPDDGRNGFPYNSFTIRRSIRSGGETEYHKRTKALKDTRLGYLFPPVTVQAYVESYSGPIISVGIIHTDTLYRAVEEYEWKTLTGKDGNTFIVLTWGLLIKRGYKVGCPKLVNIQGEVA